MESKQKETRLLMGGLLLGVGLIAAARYYRYDVSWGAGWLINALGWLIIAGVFTPLCEIIWGTKVKMKYVKAVAACAVLLGIYLTFGVLLDWHHGGGYLVLAIFFGACTSAWRHFTKPSLTNSGSEQNKASTSPPPPSEPTPFAGFQDVPVRKGERDKPQNLLGGYRDV